MSRQRAWAARPVWIVVLAVGCSRQPPQPPPDLEPSPRGGPALEVRLFNASRIDLLLPERVRILDASTGEVLLAGNLPRELEEAKAAGKEAQSGRGRSPVRVRRIGDRLYLGSWEAPGPFEIRPLGGTVPVEESDVDVAMRPPLGVVLPTDPGETRYFRGSLVVGRRNDLLDVTNKLSLEEYLLGVVGAEMVASTTPLEGLEAQAVASRTYALYGIRAAREREARPVFAGGQSFQVYRGVEREHPRVAKAVRATFGEVLTYQGRLFRAYFHSTCGGRTASASTGFGEPAIQPLEGTVCTACSGSRYARWTVTWPSGDFARLLEPWLAERDIPLGALRTVTISERWPDGRARYVRIEHDRGSFELKADRLRSLSLKIDGTGLRSTAFEVSLEGDSITFQGRGWGHGVGMCQVGAGEMGKTRSYREILAHYYPGSDVEQVYAPSTVEEGGPRSGETP